MTLRSSLRGSSESRSRILTGLLLLAVIGTVAAFEVFGDGAESRVGKRAPALPSEVIVPPSVTIASLRGEPAAINFWASWCTPCRREAPELEALHRSRNTPGNIVGVNWSDRLSAARAFVRDHRLTFPNLRDAGGEVGRAYGIVGLPVTVILDRHGRIDRVLNGPQTAAGIREAFNSIDASEARAQR